MKLTYSTLRALIDCMNDEQLHCDVTVEMGHSEGLAECCPAELRICGENHDCLDDGHPVIYIGIDPPQDRTVDLGAYYAETGLSPQLRRRTYESKLLLEDWHEIANAMGKVRDAAKEAEDILMAKLVSATDDDTRCLLLKIDNEFSVTLPACAPVLEWTGGDSSDPKNYRLREPGIVGGCSFPAYFDEEGKPIRHE